MDILVDSYLDLSMVLLGHSAKNILHSIHCNLPRDETNQPISHQLVCTGDIHTQTSKPVRKTKV